MLSKCCGLFSKAKNPDLMPIWPHDSAPLFQKFYSLPFNTELCAGTLDRPIFDRYLYDDSYYLAEYSSGLDELAQMAANKYPMLAERLIRLRQGCIEMERFMQEKYAAALKLDHPDRAISDGPVQVISEYPGKAISEYIDHLKRSIRASFEIGFAAFFPCFWAYKELGAQNLKQVAADHPYHDWLVTYTDPSYVQATTQWQQDLTELAAGASAEQQSAMATALKTSIQHEINFLKALMAPPQELRYQCN